MAEFQEVIRQARRMCEAHKDKSCEEAEAELKGENCHE